MKMSESISALATALAKAQGEMENASKNAANPHFKSKYADLSEVLNTIRPVLSKHGLAIVQMPSFAEGVAHVETMLMHSSGEWLAEVASAPVSKQDAQGVGSAITYLRRYSAAAFAAIAQEDDDANASVGGKKQPAKPPAEKQYMDVVRDHMDSVTAIRDGIKEGQLSSAAEAWFELSDSIKEALWKSTTNGGIFTTQERAVIKSTEFREAFFGPSSGGVNP